MIKNTSGRWWDFYWGVIAGLNVGAAAVAVDLSPPSGYVAFLYAVAMAVAATAIFVFTPRIDRWAKGEQP